MYQHCIFCSAGLGANESIEHFPVGRSLAFDAAKGRLWAVCPKCARWNLAPLEERWEAIEEGERLFRDARVRVQSENVGLTKLRDGTRLVRVGKTLPAELAEARYGRAFRRRHAIDTARTVGLITAGGGTVFVYSPALVQFFLLTMPALYAVQYALLAAALLPRDLVAKPASWVTRGVWKVAYGIHRLRGSRMLDVIPGDAPGERIRLTRAAIEGARLVPAEDGFAVHLPSLDLRVEGWRAQALTARRLIDINRAGGDRGDLQAAVRFIGSVGGPQGYVERAARIGMGIDAGTAYHGIQGLALEMALHEETERRAMEGELAGLEAMWAEAERVAAIADALPGEPPALQTPRI